MAIDLIFLNKYGLFGVLITTFIAYSILPFPSELAITLSSVIFNPIYVFIFAMIGSTLGSITNYYIGHQGIKKILKKNSKINKKAKKLFQKYGASSLILFSWLPFIGDPLIILAGSVEMKFWKFLVCSTIAKTFYFIVLILLGIGIWPLLGV